MQSNRFWRGPIARSALCTAIALTGANPVLARITIIPQSTIARQSMHQGDWRLEIARDAFSGELACQLRSRDGRAVYRSGGVGFQFHFVKSVTDAVYRIDRGDAHATRDDLPALIKLNTPVDHGSMGDPSDGIVWVPYDRIAQARFIAIEPERGGTARAFHLDGLAALHDIAVTRGCAPESRFVAK